MSKVRLVTVALSLMLAVGAAGRAQAGDVACCLCTDCQVGPSACSLPPISCDITCVQQGCLFGTFGDSPTCGMAAPCVRRDSVAPAPAASTAGLAAILAVLGVVAARAFRRRPL